MFKDGCHYVLRESYFDCGLWKYRDLADLGGNPGEYIEYTGGNGFYFSSALEERLQAGGGRYSSEALEHLFLPFFPPHIRRIIENFQTRRTLRRGSGSPQREQELMDAQQHLHSFDRRRMHFLRCGRVDIGDLDHRPWKFLNVLMEKSRDEMEHTIEAMEPVLRPHEMRTYLFTALHLQTRFPHHLLRNHPAALNQEAVDDFLVEALCSLNNDALFFAGTDAPDGTSLHPFLAKYLMLYFDAEFEREQWSDSATEAFRWQQFYRRRPAAAHRINLDTACKVFGIGKEDLARMSRDQLVRLYRKKAKEHHPDRGGDKESFIRMAEAFACLCATKK